MMFFSLNLCMYTRDNSYGFYDDNFNIMAKILKHFPDQDPGKTNVFFLHKLDITINKSFIPVKPFSLRKYVFQSEF
jgi:hypothetical protein